MAPDITGLGSVADLVSTTINKIWPDKTESEKAQLAAAVAMVQGQLDINKVEAASSSPFTSGWRPFLGWVCGVGCAWNWIALPAVMAVGAWMDHPLQLSRADMTEMMPLLLGMLGLGGLRTYEKVKGVAA